jgi:hypothetical protein
MNVRTILLTGLSAFLLTSSNATQAQTDIIETDPGFDAGRVQMNATLTGTRLGQWTGGAAGGNSNVGWNEQGIWYSFVRFGGVDTQGEDLAVIFEKMDAAGSIKLQTAISWYEIAEGFPGDPGVEVAVYLVPQLVVPSGSLPTTQNTWPFIYPNAVKVATIPPTVTPVDGRNNAWQFEDRVLFDPEVHPRNVEVDLTEAIKAAISAGQLDAETPWGIVFFPEAMIDQLDTPNNPAWIDKRQTVMVGGYEQLVLSDDTGGETWNGFPVGEDGWVLTGDSPEGPTWMGWVNVTFQPWVWSQSLNRYVVVPDGSGWVLISR